MEMTRLELAAAIAIAVDCTAKIWQKEGKVRVYLSHRGKDYGFIAIICSGVEFSLTSYANNAYGRVIRETVAEIEIEQETFRDQMLAPSNNKKQDSQHSQHSSEDYHFGAADEESF